MMGGIIVRAVLANETTTVQPGSDRYDVGAIDGFLGLKTRQAVKAIKSIRLSANGPLKRLPVAVSPQPPTC
jgi:hypothetical protein